MHPQKPDLGDVWRSLASRYTDDQSLAAGFYKELIDHYSEQHRFYHNLSHIKTLIQLYFEQEEAFQKPEVVLFSIFYHDVVYAPGREDNECQSALVAKRALEQLGVSSALIKDIQLYIEATSHHKLPSQAAPDLKLFIDLDLSILAADRETYQTYLRNVRKEYSYLSTEQFAIGRAAFLQYMLSQEHIFYTGSFRVKEDVARKNMQWELQMAPGIYSAC